jgi:spore germination cell wall hydrolase CwlJ-like protein
VASIAGATLLAVAACTHVPALRGALGLDSDRAAINSAVPIEQIREVEAMTVDDKSQIIVEGTEAEKRNAQIAIADPSPQSASRFVLPAGGAAYATALKCLAQAVYYEAAREPVEGQRAVAQVVLNRVRHPAYPNSVCGVVYEGFERTTGCQFSFTCDGALLRQPMKALWLQSEAVARQALAGHVQASVGMATNYHADYVLPKWAFRLAKIEQIGRHIFYRLHGRWGQRTVFTSAYSGIEHLPAINVGALQARMLANAGEAADIAPVPGLTVPPAVTDRHAANDVGGRLDVTKEWRLSIPDPVAASSKYRSAIAEDSAASPAVASESGALPSANTRVTLAR